MKPLSLFCNQNCLASNLLLAFVLTLAPLCADSEVPEETSEGAEEQKEKSFAVLSVSWNETFSRRIPAPRGEITDRNGKPLACNREVFYLALQFPNLGEIPSEKTILDWARPRLSLASKLSGKELSVSDEKLVSHYRNRMGASMLLSVYADPEEKKIWQPQLIEGLRFRAIMQREYPAKEAAAHVIGYVRKKEKMPTGPLEDKEPEWEETSGAEGLENTLDAHLTGKPGEGKLTLKEDGSELLNQIRREPIAGDTVVTTLDLDWQMHAESVLRRSCRRGAFVVVDIETGEVLVLASRPSYDLNQWIPFISADEFNKLREDEASPRLGRAFQGGYPPASTFQPVVAAAALSSGEIAESAEFNCPPFITIGGRKFHNHSRKHAGKLDVKKALATSNNPWFYQAGLKVGPTSFLSVSRRMGFGTKTGMPLYKESDGLIPNQAFMKEKEGRPFTDGDTANSSVGQGYVSATPLQVAQAMVALGNGEFLPQLRLIREIKNVDGEVLEATVPQKRNDLGLTADSVRIIREGMMQVVNASYGTGKKGGTRFCRVAGKTGSAQWRGTGKTKQELGWFAGFLPYENPRYAFAILYEGSPGQSVDASVHAAPMVGRFFDHFEKEIQETLAAEEKGEKEE